MSENHFATALRNFTMDAAAGDAIRHLTDKSYTLSRIKEALTFPAPTEYIAKTMWDRLIETHIVTSDDPAKTLPGRTYKTIEHYDEYGRKSFLQVQKESPEENIFSPEDYVQYENLWILKRAQEQVFSLSDHIPLKVRSTGSHRDM